jgi:hypothetical protein
VTPGLGIAPKTKHLVDFEYQLYKPSMKQYPYIGPKELLALTKILGKGHIILSEADIHNWFKETDQKCDQDNNCIATYIINLDHQLLIADRHSEHVACAGGEDVLSAGEITFNIQKGRVQVVDVTNQSTGYCAEPESWPVVERAMLKAQLNGPSKFTHAFIFRRCDQCDAINIVKDDWYVCAVCDADLKK